MVKCPSCGGYFCRECVSEHEDRFLCASCLAREAAGDETARPAPPVRLAGVLRLAAALALLWLVFFAVGQAVLHVPDVFHEEIEYQVVEPALIDEEQPAPRK